MKINSKMFKTVGCPECEGTGAVLDFQTGGRLKRLRTLEAVPLQIVADAMGYTRAYLSDLELDKRKWNWKLYKAYVVALEGAINDNS